MKKNRNKRSIFDDKRVVLVASLLLAVLCWIIVAGFINPGQTRIIPNVKIDYTKNEMLYQNKNLQIVSDQKDASFADVLIGGDSSLITGFTNTDVTVYPDYSAVNGPGEYEVPLKAEKITQGNYSILDLSLKNSTHSLRSSAVNTITLYFEEIGTKTLSVTVRSDGVTAADGYFKDTPAVIPGEVTITGPKSDVTRATQAVAIVDAEEERRESIIFNGVTVQLLDANNNPIESDLITMTPSDNVEVDIPILEIRDIDLSVEISGVPQYFDTEWLEERMHLSTESIQVVGATGSFENLSNPYPIYTIDLSQLELGWTSDPVTIELPEGLRGVDQLRQVAVSFESDDLVAKSFDVTNLKVVNQPRNAEIVPISDTVSNVVLIGPEDQLAALLPENITIEIDAFDVSANKNTQQTIPARVLIPSANRVFASGSYPVVCDIVVDADDSAA